MVLAVSCDTNIELSAVATAKRMDFLVKKQTCFKLSYQIASLYIPLSSQE